MTIIGDELHALHYRLRQHETVEGIGVQRRQALDECGMSSIHIQKSKACRLKLSDSLVGRNRWGVRPAKRALYCDLPNRGD